MSDPTIYIAVRGGIVQGVRVKNLPSDCDVRVYDYDCDEADDGDLEIDGKTWDDISKDSEGVY